MYKRVRGSRTVNLNEIVNIECDHLNSHHRGVKCSPYNKVKTSAIVRLNETSSKHHDMMIVSFMMLITCFIEANCS